MKNIQIIMETSKICTREHPQKLILHIPFLNSSSEVSWIQSSTKNHIRNFKTFEKNLNFRSITNTSLRMRETEISKRKRYSTKAENINEILPFLGVTVKRQKINSYI